MLLLLLFQAYFFYIFIPTFVLLFHKGVLDSLKIVNLKIWYRLESVEIMAIGWEVKLESVIWYF